MDEMFVKMLPVADILPYARNPRKNEKAVADMASSIKEFGFRQPIVVDENNTIIVGHTRWLAAKNLNRNFIGIEISKEYCELGKKRMGE